MESCVKVVSQSERVSRDFQADQENRERQLRIRVLGVKNRK